MTDDRRQETVIGHPTPVFGLVHRAGVSLAQNLARAKPDASVGVAAG
jgi:hypothetical protein